MNRPVWPQSARSFFGYTNTAMRAVKSFLGQQHRLQCKRVLGDECGHVHARLDRKLGGGRLHRIHDHNEEFITRTFHTLRDKRAARIHLLGDYISDILPDVLGHAIHGMEKAALRAPGFTRRGQKPPQWDISESAKEKLVRSLSKSLISALNNRNRLT